MFIRKYTELFLYGLLILSLLSYRFLGFPNLSPIILFLPLAFIPSERLGIKSPWNLSLFSLPFLHYLYPENFLNLALQALAEETFFRAYLMSRFSLLFTSVLFTLPHVILYGDLWSVLTFFPSLLFGVVYQRTGSLVFVSLLHLLSNLLWFNFLYPLLTSYGAG
ncbi:MAG: CPBP family glutamic-type intramembrane protease [Aquificaceae bacterium]|nr:CPBP family glutamic-type intramembrane protease [Aquificaceae bacterium]